jgi:hypothetical protein
VAGALVQAALVQAALVVPELALVAQAPEPAVEALEPAGPVLALAAGARVPAEARALAPQAQVQVALQARAGGGHGSFPGPSPRRGTRTARIRSQQLENFRKPTRFLRWNRKRLKEEDPECRRIV